MEELIKFKKMTCDNCKKINSQSIAIQDNTTFNGWFKCERINIPESATTDKNLKINNKSFCSLECLTLFYQK